MNSAPTTPWQFPIYANIRGNKNNSDSDSEDDSVIDVCGRPIKPKLDIPEHQSSCLNYSKIILFMSNNVIVWALCFFFSSIL